MYFILFCVFTVQTLASGIMGLVLSQSRKRSSNLVRFSRLALVNV